MLPPVEKLGKEYVTPIIPLTNDNPRRDLDEWKEASGVFLNSFLRVIAVEENTTTTVTVYPQNETVSLQPGQWLDIDEADELQYFWRGNDIPKVIAYYNYDHKIVATEPVLVYQYYTSALVSSDEVDSATVESAGGRSVAGVTASLVGSVTACWALAKASARPVFGSVTFPI